MSSQNLVVYLSRAVNRSIPSRHFGMIRAMLCRISIQISRAMVINPMYMQP